MLSTISISLPDLLLVVENPSRSDLLAFPGRVQRHLSPSFFANKSYEKLRPRNPSVEREIFKKVMWATEQWLGGLKAMMQEVLSFYEAFVLTAIDGTDALDQVQKHKPDIIVSDIIMPRMDGYHFIREVRSLEPQNGGEIPAVALTALNRFRDRTRAVKAGYQYYLVKPFDMDVLIDVLGRLAGKMQWRGPGRCQSGTDYSHAVVFLLEQL
jgi:CheY-like chemotaxis protein